MNVYIMTDIEGISGIYTRSQVIEGEPRFNEGRKFMTADINACAAGLKAGGADKIYVCDCHAMSYTVLWDELSSDIEYCICGSTADKRYYGIEECDAVVLLGYHAMAGTQNAVLEHSYNSKKIQRIYANGKEAGELAFDAAVAGEYGRPVIMVSGDDKICAEAKNLLPNVTTACVKKGTDIFGAMLYPPEKAHDIIFNAAKEAVQNIKNCGLFTFSHPIKCEVEVTERTEIQNGRNYPGYRVNGGRTVEITADTAEEAVFRICSI